MQSHAIAQQLLQQESPAQPLIIRYLGVAKAAPQVLRLAETNASECEGMQQAYLCSEKRKVRKVGGSEATDNERLRRCRLADKQRHAIHTRTSALARPIAQR